MIYILLAVLFSSMLYVVLKLFTKFEINTFQAIVFNYLTAFIVGYLFSTDTIKFSALLNKSWIGGSFLLGGLFILVFTILGKTAQENGISVASVSSKMSMIIPVIFGIVFFKENLSTYKILGILLAIIAVYFTSKKENGTLEFKNFLMPTLLFFGAGIVDTSMNYMQHTYLKTNEIALFSALTFLSAFIFGTLISIGKLIKGNLVFKAKNNVAGIILGIPNYFSMYYLIKALGEKKLESASVFTLINVGVILISTFFSILLFNEKRSKNNWFGMLLALLAVFLVTAK